MATLSPPNVLNRARSSSTAGNLTTARSRSTQPDPFTDPLPSLAVALASSQSQSQVSSAQSSSSSPSKAPPSASELLQQSASLQSSSSSAGMFNVLYSVAARVMPLHDALTSASPLPKEKSDKDLHISSAKGVVAFSDEWGTQQVDVVAELPNKELLPRSSNKPPHRTRPLGPKRAHKRTPSPFSSLFISPPSSTLPPPVSSPRTSGSFSRFTTSLSISIPTTSASATATQRPPGPPLSKLIFPLVAVCSLFFITFLPVLYGIWSLPIHSLKHMPKTVNDIKAVARDLDDYASSSPAGFAHIVAVLAVTSVWKNAWSVPGSALLNVLAGALMNPVLATLLQTTLTTIGSICSTLLSKPLAPVLSYVFPRALHLTRTAFEGSSTPTTPVDEEETEKLLSDPSSQPKKPAPTPVWVRLTVLRLVGVVPWSALNLVCGVCNVPLWDCTIGSFVGVLPWTAVTCQIGDILQTVASTSASTATADVASTETLSSLLTSPSIIIKLVCLSLLSLGPVLMRDRLSDLISRSRRRSRRLASAASSSSEVESDLESEKGRSS